MEQSKDRHINSERSIQEINNVGSCASHYRGCFFKEFLFRGPCQIETDKEENRSIQNEENATLERNGVLGKIRDLRRYP